MKITFLGVGSAFTTRDYYQSNMLVRAENGAGLLLDCGSDIRFMLAEAGLDAAGPGSALDAVYISHCHADHIGGLEFLAFSTYFGGERRALKLFAQSDLLGKLWNESLQGGLGRIQGRPAMQLADYFHCRPLPVNGRFDWQGIGCQMAAMPHLANGAEVVYSHGLLLGEKGRGQFDAFISTDARFCPDAICRLAGKAELIFHDCETTPFKSGVHAHFDELCTLPAAVRSKIWLYHHHPDPPQDPQAHGFRGFVRKGQEFSFSR